MKKIYYNLYIWTVLALLALSGCSKSYLELKPTQSIDPETAVSSLDNIDRLLNGINNRMYLYRYDQGSVGEAALNMKRDMLGEDVINSTTGNGWQIGESRWLSHTNERGNLSYLPWRFYSMLRLNTNYIIQAIDAFSKEGEKYHTLKGEALAYRAFANFQAVQLYGKSYTSGSASSNLGIVLRDGVDFEPKARSTVEETYQSIIGDLDLSIENMEKGQNLPKNRLSYKVALGLRARVELSMGHWDKAAEYAEKAIKQAKKEGLRLQKANELLDGFNSLDAGEWMWGYTQTDDQNLYYGSFFAYMSWNFSSSNIRSNPKLVNSALYDTMSETDVRRGWWDPTGKKWKKPKKNFKSLPYENHKFEAKSMSNSGGDVVLMRLAEMYLIRAEALAHAGKDAEAKKVLTEYAKTRDPKFSAEGLSGEGLLEDILRQRRIELWGEGFRFTDLKRLNLPLDRMKAPNTDPDVSRRMLVPVGHNDWQFLIPKSELDANPLCVQNEI